MDAWRFSEKLKGSEEPEELKERAAGETVADMAVHIIGWSGCRQTQ